MLSSRALSSFEPASSPPPRSWFSCSLSGGLAARGFDPLLRFFAGKGGQRAVSTTSIRQLRGALFLLRRHIHAGIFEALNQFAVGGPREELHYRL